MRDYRGFVAAGEAARARGAGIVLMRSCLMLAATPAPDAETWDRKLAVLDGRFAAAARSLGYANAVRLADAAIDAERVIRSTSSVGIRLRLGILGGRQHTDAYAPAPLGRSNGYAAALEAEADLQAVLDTIGRLCSDKATLARDGRGHGYAARGLDRLLADALRALCVMPTRPDPDAGTKRAVLEAAKPSVGSDVPGQLMAAVIEAAIAKTSRLPAWEL
jgi:hypothetical protein